MDVGFYVSCSLVLPYVNRNLGQKTQTSKTLKSNTGLVKIMLTLLRTVLSSIPREMCVRALNGTVARWLLCVKHDGEQVETVL